MWNPNVDPALVVHYDRNTVLKCKKENKLALQSELGLVQDEGKLVIGLISRLTNQKGLDLVNAIIPQVMDGNTQVVVLKVPIVECSVLAFNMMSLELTAFTQVQTHCWFRRVLSHAV